MSAHFHPVQLDAGLHYIGHDPATGETALYDGKTGQRIDTSPPCVQHTAATGKKPTGLTFDEAAKHGQQLHDAITKLGVSVQDAKTNLDRFSSGLAAGATVFVNGKQLGGLKSFEMNPPQEALYKGFPVHSSPLVPEDQAYVIDPSKLGLSDLFRQDPDRTDLEAGHRPPNLALTGGLYQPDPHRPPDHLWERATARARELGHVIRWSTWTEPAWESGPTAYLTRKFRIEVEPAGREPYAATTSLRCDTIGYMGTTIPGSIDPAVCETQWEITLEQAGILDYGNDG